MTTELWLVKPCQKGCNLANANFCDHEDWVRLDPDQALLFKPDPAQMGETIVYLDVKDVIEAVKDVYDDALTEQETDQ